MHFSWWKIVSAIVSVSWALRTALIAGRGSFCPCAEGWWFYLPGWFGADCLALPSSVDKDKSFEMLPLANVVNWWLWSAGKLDPALATVWEATKSTSQTDHAFSGAFTDKHRKNATYEVKAPYEEECVYDVYVGKSRTETQKEKGLDTRIR